MSWSLMSTVFFAGIALLLCLVQPSAAADPVEIEIRGIEGDSLKNVRETLVLPVGLVHERGVDRLWLDRFVHQSEDKVKGALEPYGYYNARISFKIEQVKPERYRLLVTV